MKEEVERIKKLVGIDHNRWEQPCACDKCKNMCKVPCIGTPKDIEAIIDAGYADRLKETMWMVGYLTVTRFVWHMNRWQLILLVLRVSRYHTNITVMVSDT